MIEFVVKAKLLAIRDGTYTMYVFKNLDSGEYHMCTRLPNWECPEVFIGQEGFLQMQIVIAGEEYFDVATGESKTYKYSNVYFKNFVSKSDITNNKIFL